MNSITAPTTLAGIKRNAKKLKKAKGLKQHEALNLVAIEAGYQNFRHAQSSLSDHSISLRLTAYWKDPIDKIGGVESLVIQLSNEWNQLIRPPQLLNHRALGGFRETEPGHLELDYIFQNVSTARNRVCAAARVMHFINATGLRPSSGNSRAFPNGDSANRIPGQDHISIWFEPVTKRYLIADEPYKAAVEDRTQERQEWAERHGFDIVMPTWSGMYAPSRTQLYLLADREKGVLLQPLVTKLNRLPSPLVEEKWQGESSDLSPFILNPNT